MGDVTQMPRKKKKVEKRLVTVCWGGFQQMHRTDHIAVGAKGCTIDPDSGLLLVDEGDDKLTCYPIGSVFYWAEKDAEPDPG